MIQITSTRACNQVRKRVGVLAFITLAFTTLNVASQRIKRSTITAASSQTTYVTIQNKNLEVLQSIGQQSVIGSKKISGLQIQQGFLTNTKYYKIDNSGTDQINESISLTVSPNPFVDHVQLKFAKKTKHDVYIRIYDLNGKLILTKKHQPTENIYVPLKQYSIGTYFMNVQSGMQRITKKLIKPTLR